MNEPDYLIRHQIEKIRQRRTVILGIVLLLSGYAILAISPDTPSDTVLLRVGIGFGLLFIGFILAILPLFLRITRNED